MGSVRAVTNGASLKAERTLYFPFGKDASTRSDLSIAVETKRFIAKRLDADAASRRMGANPRNTIAARG